MTVDDVVVLYKDGRACFIQAKKNQPQHKPWSFADRILQDELCKARDQLETKANSEVCFYSRSPFGELKALAEGCLIYPDFLTFTRDAPHTLSKFLKRLVKILERSEQETFSLVKRLKFGPAHEFEDWDYWNRTALDRVLPRADLAIPILERCLESHQSNLRDAKYVITRNDVLVELDKHGLSPTPKRTEAEILEVFRATSQIGRNWLRTIDGAPIPRPELSHLIKLIEQGSRTILLTDRPGSGKTCILLDLADYIEQSTSWGLLFIKGDQFADVNTETDLTARGLPADIVGQCARLAGYRHVVVILDSLDVLSLSRRHSALKIFLGMLDRLERVVDVTVVVACRDFDLRYDPLLRSRKWQHAVTLTALDFEEVVEPLLRKWGVDPDSLSAELRALLQLPQNLRLFEKLTVLGTVSHLISAYELYEQFLEEVVVKDPLLGNAALASLQDMAERLLQQRSQSCPKVSFRADETIVQRLISQEVLFEPSPGVLTFSHQTLADGLIVRSALAQDSSLADFILAHPQLPFIRPAVRAFFFSLRAQQPDAFRRQVWAVLSHNEIAYHLKRLVSESLAEITPVEKDWPLLRRLFRQYPDLFRRLFRRTESDAWFELLTQYWLPEAKTSQDRENWLLQFVNRLGMWINRHTAEVLALWQESLTSAWADKQHLVQTISSKLNQCELWPIEGMRELLEILVEETRGNWSFLGKSLSHWVQATNGGDDLLWKYITRNITPDVTRWDLGKKLRCASHDFNDDQFLVERLRRSDELLTLVVDDLGHWHANNARQSGGYGLSRAFLDTTSWGQRHNRHDRHHADSLNTLLDGLEDALKFHSRQNDAWWRVHEPRLRVSCEMAVRYFIIQAYQENIQANISGIEVQLTDKELFQSEHLAYELGELIRAAYPFISESAQDANQALILTLYIHEDRGADGLPQWAFRNIYQCLIWIPSVFRTPETQDFIGTWEGHFGYCLPSPQIHSSSGSVDTPLSSEDLLRLSDETLFRLLRHYTEYNGLNEMLGNRLVGGRDAVLSVLRESASRHPERFLALFNRFIEEDLRHSFIHAVIDGFVEHLRYRFENVGPSNGWEPIEPVPDGDLLALTLLALLERYPIIWENDWTISHALDVCCRVLTDSESAERLTVLLFPLLRAESPSEEQTAKDSKDLVSIAINSTRGVAAASAMILCNNLLENDYQPPELLPPLLRHFARDSAVSVRVSILQRLPYLLYKRPSLGWQLFADIFREPQTHLWSHAEQCFYHQYHDRFDKVEPYLDRLLQEGMEEAGDTWGRISTLASLAGHISQDQLFRTLSTANAKAWKGAAEVFRANLGQSEHTDICRDGLLTTLRQDNLSEVIFRIVENSFSKEVNRGLIKHELALAFLDAFSSVENHHDISHFLEWLGHEARRDPLSALEIAEVLADKLAEQEGSNQLWQTEPLIAALVEILREADEIDDPALIQRVISLQDRFLKLDVRGIDELFDEAGKS